MAGQIEARVASPPWMSLSGSSAPAAGPPGSIIDSTGTSMRRSSGLPLPFAVRAPASISVTSRRGPTRKRPISSSGFWVALRPIRWKADSCGPIEGLASWTSASRRSSVRARCEPRLEWATAWISSTITVSIPASIERAWEVRIR
jgi:hypothetical protein